MQNEPLDMDLDHLVAAASFAMDIMRQGDAVGELDNLMSRQLAADAEFRRRAYAAWPRFPDHPAAPALATLQRLLLGEEVALPAFSGLSWLGDLLAEHEDDWRGRESQLGARLRSPANFESCLFELEASRLLRHWGHKTRWLWPNRPEDADLLLDEAVGVECVHARAGIYSGIQRRAAMDLLSSLLTSMRKQQRNLVLVIEVVGSLRRADIPGLRAAIRTAIQSGLEGYIDSGLPQCTVRLDTLAPYGSPIDPKDYSRFENLHAREAFRVGHVENSPEGQPVNPCMAVLRPVGVDGSIIATCRSALSKHDQLKGDRPAVVAPAGDGRRLLPGGQSSPDQSRGERQFP